MNDEAKLISAIVKNSDMASVLQSSGIDELFVSHKDIWDGIKTYYYKYRSAPTFEVIRQIAPDFEPVEVTAPTRFYIENLKNNTLTKKLSAIRDGIESAIESSIASDRILNHLQKRVIELSRFSAGIKDLNVGDYANATRHYEQVQERVREMGGAVGIKTGFDSIDSAYSTGQAPGHMICIIGWPGHKKTFMAGELAINVWKQNRKPMIVSLEMSPENMRDRIYTLMGEGMWRMSGFNRGNFNLQEFKQWAEKEFEDRPDFIIVSNEGSAEVTPATIQAKIDQYKPDWVLVDYLQLLNDNKKSGQDTARVMNISKELKALAMANNIPVVVIVSATSSDKEDRNSPPILGQVAWAKSIEYDADMAFAVHTYENSDTGEKITEIVKRKNRHGDDFCFYVDLNPETGELREVWEAPDWLN